MRATYRASFDGGDSGNPIASGNALSSPGNVFSEDSNCVALWQFDTTGSFTSDAIGENNLTNSGATIETSLVKQGRGSVVFDATGTDNFKITDANLDTGFPLKNGDSNKKISVAFWFRPTALTGVGLYKFMFAKYDVPGLKRSFAITIKNDAGTGKVSVIQGHTNGTAFQETVEPNVAITLNQWYHIGVTYDDSTRALVTRLYDQTADTSYTDSNTLLNDINIEDADFAIGVRPDASTDGFEGYMDEMVVFKDILSTAQIDEIKNGTYGTPKTATCTAITYSDASSGTISYQLDLGSEQYVDDDIIGSGGNTVVVNGVPTNISTAESDQLRTTAFPQDYTHLEGQTVDVMQDGVITAGQTVASGSVTLTGSVNHVGLNYVSTAKPMKLDLEGMGVMLVKNITKAWVSFYNTFKGKVGTDTTNELETVSFDTMETTLKEVPLYGGYEREGDVIVKQDQPAPMTCRGMVLDLGAHFK